MFKNHGTHDGAVGPRSFCMEKSSGHSSEFTLLLENFLYMGPHFSSISSKPKFGLSHPSHIFSFLPLTRMEPHCSSMEEDHHQYQERQLLSCTPNPPPPSSSHPPPWPSHFEAPSLDLQLSISVAPLKPPSDSRVLIRKVREFSDVKIDSSCVEAMKWQAAEQVRLAAMEKAYAEHVMEMTRKEMDLAHSESARARSLWERAMEEVERAEKMKERATQKMDSSCMEITCLSCRQKFRP